MGRSDRRMHRAIEAVDKVYGRSFASWRLEVGRLVTNGVDDDVLAALWSIHDECRRAARAAADRVGGPGWMARAGVDDESESARLWSEHGEPLTAVRYVDLARR